MENMNTLILSSHIGSRPLVGKKTVKISQFDNLKKRSSDMEEKAHHVIEDSHEKLSFLLDSEIISQNVNRQSHPKTIKTTGTQYSNIMTSMLKQELTEIKVPIKSVSTTDFTNDLPAEKDKTKDLTFEKVPRMEEAVIPPKRHEEQDSMKSINSVINDYFTSNNEIKTYEQTKTVENAEIEREKPIPKEKPIKLSKYDADKKDEKVETAEKATQPVYETAPVTEKNIIMTKSEKTGSRKISEQLEMIKALKERLQKQKEQEQSNANRFVQEKQAAEEDIYEHLQAEYNNLNSEYQNNETAMKQAEDAHNQELARMYEEYGMQVPEQYAEKHKTAA